MSRPLLSDHFFTQVPPPNGFWEKWGHQAEWTEQLVPLYEWNSILFVGTLESIQGSDLSLEVKVVLIDANPVSLKAYFNKIKSASKPVKIPNAIPALTNDGMPADPFAALISITSAAPEKDSQSPSLDLLGELVLTDEPALDSEATAEVEAQAEEPSLNELQLFTGDELRKGQILNPTASAGDPAQAPVAKPLHESKAPAQVVFEASTPPPVRKTAGPPKTGNDNLSTKLLEQMRNHYQKSMLLKKEGNAMVPWRWDSQFKSLAQNEEPFSLGTPSPFRIVSRTLKPFHGRVVPGEIQEKFFDDWNESQLPDFLTISPVMVNDQLVGMLLSIADKHVNLKASLQLSEKIAEEFSKTFANSPQLLAS